MNYLPPNPSNPISDSTSNRIAKAARRWLPAIALVATAFTTMAAVAQEAEVPAPDENGDFTSATLRGNVGNTYRNTRWLVVDPDPTYLNCRVQPTVNSDVRSRLAPGSVLVADFQQNEAIVINNDGESWLRVAVATPRAIGGSGTCYVRANIEYIAPILQSADVPDVSVTQPQPEDTPVSSLPDGNYRYWTGDPGRDRIVDDDTLLQNGGVLFLFRKDGDDVVGVYGPIDGEAICLNGQVNGDTVTGIGVTDNEPVRSDDNQYANWDPSGHLQIRRGRRVGGGLIQYNSALLNLADFNRINAGTRLPPMECR